MIVPEVVKLLKFIPLPLFTAVTVPVLKPVTLKDALLLLVNVAVPDE